MILEHLWDIKNLLRKVDKFLKKDGYLFITVPDAGNFYNNFEEPFGEFSSEHINFYSIPSLFRLLKSYQCSYIKTDNKNIYSLWKKGSGFEDAINRYIKLSDEKLQSIRKSIDKAPGELIVWELGL